MVAGLPYHHLPDMKNMFSRSSFRISCNNGKQWQVRRAGDLREATSKSSSVYITANTKYSYKLWFLP